MLSPTRLFPIFFVNTRHQIQSPTKVAECAARMTVKLSTSHYSQIPAARSELAPDSNTSVVHTAQCLLRSNSDTIEKAYDWLGKDITSLKLKLSIKTLLLL